MPLPDRSYLQKVEHLRAKCLLGMTEWEKNFLRDINANLQDDDELTSLQKDKINEIWSAQGLMKSTSLESLESILPQLGDRQRAVFLFLLEHGPLCNLGIADGMGLAINTVTPRVLELRQMNLVVEAYEAESPTGKRSKFWRAQQEPINFQPRFKNPGNSVGSGGGERQPGVHDAPSPDSFRVQNGLFDGRAA